MATHIQDAIQQVMMVQEVAVSLSVNIGIALYPDDGETLADLLQHVDEALYHVKDADRAHFAFYSSVTGVGMESLPDAFRPFAPRQKVSA